MLQAVEQTTPVPASAVPAIGNFYSAQHPPDGPNAWPPLPGNTLDLPAWNLGDSFYLINDLNVDYDALQAQAAQAMSASPMLRLSMANNFASSFAYGNTVYLANFAATLAADGSITANFNIAGGTNFVPYDILTTTNLATPIANWNWIGIGYTSKYYTFTEQPGSVGFYMLAEPSKTMTVGFGSDAVDQCDVPYGLTNALQVAGGVGHSVALLNNGTVVAWGWNNYGQATVPTNLPGVAMVTAGWYHSAALLTNGTVRTWGMSGPPFFVDSVPSNLTNATVVSAQAVHTLALTSNGTVVAWGYNSGYGEASVPAGISNAVAISAGFEFNLVVITNGNGTVVAWGDDNDGETNVPPGLSNVVDVAAGVYHSLALLNNGTVMAWGSDDDGETDVPAGLTNVVAIAAGGDPYYTGYYTAYSMALRKDGTIVVWGDDDAVDPVGGLSNVIAIVAGGDHALAVRTGPPTPVITLEPTDEYQVQGSNATFTVRGAGLDGVTYQWQFTNVDILGATNATLTVTNVQPAQLGSYDVIVTDNGGMGSITSSNASLYFVTLPVINSPSQPVYEDVLPSDSVTLNALASAPGQNNGFPLSYQWQFDGTNISDATSSNYTFTALDSGTYSVIVSNAAGTASVSWQITVVYPGGVIGWGSNSNGQLNASSLLTNVISVAAGTAHGVVALDSGSVSNWGSYWTVTNSVSVTAPPPLTNALAVAAGSRHDLALKTDGTVVAWGLNDFGQTNVPPNTTNVVAIAAGGQESLALLKNGTVVEWGQTNAPIPTGLTNVTAIAAGTNFNLALLQNSTVVAWGANNFGQTNVPAGLSNVVAIAAGGAHALALEQNGTVSAWGDNTYGETNVPLNLTNAMKIAAGNNHGVALENNGMVIAWGDYTYGQTNVPGGLNNVKFIAGGGNFTLAVQFSPTVMYPVNVAQDMLLIYNTNSLGSTTVMNYYLENRPMVSGANVLGIACPTNEIASSVTFSNDVLAPYLTWLTNNPTKHPQYLVLFMDIPSRVEDTLTYPSVQYQLSTNTTGIQPFVTSINMNGLNGSNDCIAYINKLASIATNYSPGKLVISASAGGYGNTNFVLDGIRDAGPSPLYADYSSDDYVVSSGTNGLLAAGISTNAMFFYDGVVISNNLAFGPPHATGLTNVAGYISWGVHAGLTNTYPIDGEIVWNGNSDWWIIETIESFNGQRNGGQGNFLEWYARNAFGGTNYSDTPIGAVSHVEEPGLAVNNSSIYFGLWAAGKNFAICAWNSSQTPYFQSVGDPLVTK